MHTTDAGLMFPLIVCCSGAPERCTKPHRNASRSLVLGRVVHGVERDGSVRDQARDCGPDPRLAEELR